MSSLVELLPGGSLFLAGSPAPFSGGAVKICSTDSIFPVCGLTLTTKGPWDLLSSLCSKAAATRQRYGS